VAVHPDGSRLATGSLGGTAARGDAVTGGPGSDTVYIFDVCEVAPFEVLDGSLGTDTLVTPVSVQKLNELGVVVTSFENVVIDTTNGYLSECK